MDLLATALLFVLSSSSPAVSTLNDLVNRIDDSPSIKVLEHRSLALSTDSKGVDNWSDPIFGFAFRNLPVKDPALDKTPMTGLEVSVSQRFPLTNKYRYKREYVEAKANEVNLDAELLRRKITMQILSNAISKSELLENKSIYEESIGWFDTVIDVSNRLYSNGKVSQKELVALKIRRSIIESRLSDSIRKLDEIKVDIANLIGSENHAEDIDLASIPWKYIESYDKIEEVDDPREKLLLERERGYHALKKEKKGDLIPEITLGLSYVFRSDIDKIGDFIGGSISFPLTVKGSQRSSYKSAIENYYASLADIERYKRERRLNLERILLEIKRYAEELKILKDKTIGYATLLLDINFKGYSVGTVKYSDLILSEADLQMFKLEESKLTNKIKLLKLSYIYEAGYRLIPKEIKDEK